MRTLSLRAFVLFVAAGALLGVTAMTLLPHDKFLRYQALNDGTAPTAYWIYERIHTDPTPIDIAFIGTSRTGLGVHTRRLEDDLQRQGVAARAVNLHVVKSGVNMQYVIAKELLEHRKVKLLVVEIIEYEDRIPHPDFIYLADTADILDAPLFVNVNYFSDLARLPGRQVDLFLQTQLQERGLHTPEFALPPYEGPNLDHAEFIRTLDGVMHMRDERHSLAEMEALREAQERAITRTLMPPALQWLEFRQPRYYRERILELARAHDAKVLFLYAPRYGGPAQPAPYALYADRVGLINPWPRLQDYTVWGDVTHLNWEGAQRLTDFIADDLARRPELR